MKEVIGKWQWGFIFRWGSGWVGYHWSPRERRLCINLLPWTTFWITAPGGEVPYYKSWKGGSK